MIRDSSKDRGGTLSQIKAAIHTGDAARLQDALRRMLLETLNALDTGGGHKEQAYHMLLLGMLWALMGSYAIVSNADSGDGRYDICLSPFRKRDAGVIIELKAGSDLSEEDLEALANKALTQIETKHYDAGLRRDGVSRIFKFGVAFSQKHVKIVYKQD